MYKTLVCILRSLDSSEDLTHTELTPNIVVRNTLAQYLLTYSSTLDIHIQRRFFGP